MLLSYDLLPIESRHHWGSANTWPLTYFRRREDQSNIIGDKLLSGLESFLKGGLVACLTPVYKWYVLVPIGWWYAWQFLTRNHEPSIYMSLYTCHFGRLPLNSIICAVFKLTSDMPGNPGRLLRILTKVYRSGSANLFVKSGAFVFFLSIPHSLTPPRPAGMKPLTLQGPRDGNLKAGP